MSRLTPSETSSRNLRRSNLRLRRSSSMCHVKRRQCLQPKWHLSSGLSTEILLRGSGTDLPSINAAKATKVDGSFRKRTRASPRGFSVDFRNTLRLPRGSNASRRAKYNSLSNVRPEDRQVGTLLRLLASPGSSVKTLHRLGTVGNELSQRKNCVSARRLGTLLEKHNCVSRTYQLYL